jgi:hydrogenase maturation protease
MLIIGCGNRQRSDDGAGILVAERLRELGIEADTRIGEAADLIEAWKGADDVIIVDAVVTGAPVGTVQAWDDRQPLASVSTTVSTHGLGVAEAIELAHVLDRLPARLRIYGVEGRRFEPGTEISFEVQRAVEEVVRRIIADVSASPGCRRCR